MLRQVPAGSRSRCKGLEWYLQRRGLHPAAPHPAAGPDPPRSSCGASSRRWQLVAGWLSWLQRTVPPQPSLPSLPPSQHGEPPTVPVPHTSGAAGRAACVALFTGTRRV